MAMLLLIKIQEFGEKKLEQNNMQPTQQQLLNLFWHHSDKINKKIEND